MIDENTLPTDLLGVTIELLKNVIEAYLLYGIAFTFLLVIILIPLSRSAKWNDKFKDI